MDGMRVEPSHVRHPLGVRWPPLDPGPELAVRPWSPPCGGRQSLRPPHVVAGRPGSPPRGGRQTLKPVTWWPSDLEARHVVAVRP